MASLAQTLRIKSTEVRNEKYSKPSSSEKTKEDLDIFFKYIKNDAVNKMQNRAEKGYNSANILEYSYAEYFFVDENNEIIRTPKFSKPTKENAKAYRIFEAVRTVEFKELLDDYQKELGTDMEIAVWWPGGNINVIEAIWGPTKYHRKNTKTTSVSPITTNTTNILASDKTKDATSTPVTTHPAPEKANTSGGKSSYATIAKSPKHTTQKVSTIDFNDDEE